MLSFLRKLEIDLPAAALACGVLVLASFLIVRESILPANLYLLVFAAGGVYCLWIRRPEIFLGAFIAYLPLCKLLHGDRDISHFLIGLHFITALGLLAVFTAAGRKDKTAPGAEEVWIRRLLAALLSLQILSILSGWAYGLSYLQTAAWSWVEGWGTPVIVFFAVSQAAKDPRCRRTLVVIMMAAVMMVVLLLLREHLEIGETGSFDRSRAAGIAGEPNMTASFINLSVFLFAGLFLYFWKRPLAWAGAFASLLGFRGIMVTYSRGGYLGFAAGLLALSFYRSKILFLILLAAAGIAVLKPAYLPAPIRARVEATFEHKAHGEVGLEKSAGDRVLIWRGALRLIREYPVFGTGFDLFEKRVAPFWSGTRPFNAHNAYLMVAAETGIPSLVIFLSLLGLFFKSAQRLMTETKDLQVKGVCLGFLAGLSAFMMQNLYIDSFSWQEVSLYLWVMIAVIGAALAGMNKKVSAEVPS